MVVACTEFSIKHMTHVYIFHPLCVTRGSTLHSIRSESKHTSASRKILAQVQEASRRMAADLEAKYSNSKVITLQPAKD